MTDNLGQIRCMIKSSDDVRREQVFDKQLEAFAFDGPPEPDNVEFKAFSDHAKKVLTERQREREAE
jgi:hypothetical protein